MISWMVLCFVAYEVFALCFLVVSSYLVSLVSCDSAFVS